MQLPQHNGNRARRGKWKLESKDCGTYLVGDLDHGRSPFVKLVGPVGQSPGERHGKGGNLGTWGWSSSWGRFSRHSGTHESGTMMRKGPLIRLCSMRYVMRAMVWMVFPNPISSARIPLRLLLYRDTSHSRPLICRDADENGNEGGRAAPSCLGTCRQAGNEVRLISQSQLKELDVPWN